MKTLVLNSGKCSWQQCVFCGYSKDEHSVNTAKLKTQIDAALDDDFKVLKIFGSGSFFDDAQFPKDFREYLAKKCHEKSVALISESRPEFITKETLAEFEGIDLTVAIGLEVADNKSLQKIKKGFTVEQFVAAAELLHAHKCKVRTYLLVNPPFVEDVKKSIHDSVAFAKKYSDSIVAINCLPHGKAELFDMWARGEWQPLSREEFRKATDGLGVELDEETFRFIPRFPKKEFIDGVSVEILHHPHFEVWQNYLQTFYDKPEHKDVVLFVPCAAKKPYFESKTHRLIHKVIKELPSSTRIHRVVVSNPGVVPEEFWGNYPFTAYDWDERLETPEIMKEYVKANTERVKKYLARQKYTKFFAFMKYSETFDSIKAACPEVVNCLSKETAKKYSKPLFEEEALEELRAKLSTL